MTSSSSVDELPSAAAETPTSQIPSDITSAPVDPIPASDDVEAVGEKRKREDENTTNNLESSDPNPTPSPWFKTSLCSYFRRQGSCSHGATCKYAHGEKELRQKPDNTWDPTSERGKKAKMSENAVKEEEEEEVGDVMFTEEMMDENDGEGGGGEGVVHDLSLSKCLVHLPTKWQSDDLKTFLREQGVEYKFAKKRRGMMVGFLTFENAEQLKNGVEILEGKNVNNKSLKIADVLPRTFDKNGAKNPAAKLKSAREAVTPLADLSYADQLEQKKASIAQMLKKLTRNARKACPNGKSLPEWVLQSREIGGLSCKLEGIIESPLVNGYRNKCEFSTGYSVEGKLTVGFMLGNFSAGVTAVEEAVNCPNISKLACRYASIFQSFLEKSRLPVWNRFKSCGFWRQLTVREGSKPGVVSNDEDADSRIAEVLLMVQVCTKDTDEAEVATEFEELAKAFAEGAKASSPPLPLTVLVVQDHVGISNVAPPDCPLRLLPIPVSDNGTHQDQSTNVLTEARIHDHINNLRFSISPTAFFQVNTCAAEKLYSLAGDWADLGPDTLLFDVCCGTGTIGLTLAHRVGMVIGIEMNASAVSDAERNAKINGISNCKFICSKAEDVMSSLLTEYLDVSETEEAKPPSDDDLDKQNSSAEEISNSEDVQKTEQKNSSEPERSTKPQFKNVVAIVDPPRPGLHPDVIKALRTHPRLKTLVYISCNPETLVANAIELCTPSFEKTGQENKGYRRQSRMGTAALARHRAKKMPASEPFKPVKAMAVDLFPHTDHCEMVMLLNR
ncbi:Zinc finger CCCH domain-containing protein 24 [Raphanus sativus]|uniref:Zinc finger CCCH domain-containing protein 24 n=1 Tax=Raphanus sativus TaxID=3726 RepID=A0A6J0K1J6_RAPSA|nr:zinc finger CCCH domain-containing protein 24 [Raphanus sativus]KAJ4891196.1 Zinc finger CCCH domain-containing protein 24 [Raphanus sativus]